VSWEILVFLFGVFVLVIGLRNVGVVAWLAEFYAAVRDPQAQLGAIVGISAIGSALLNNHPMALLNTLAVQSLPENTLHHFLAVLIGGDLGPRLLPTGSLAGLLWLDALARHRVYVGVWLFFRIGLAVAGPTLLVSLGILLFYSQW
jgi:arsenical pump membrane protein